MSMDIHHDERVDREIFDGHVEERRGKSGETGCSSNMRIEDVLKSEGLFVSTTVGISRWPMLRNRHDTIIVRPYAPASVAQSGEERLAVGEVPLYRSNGRYVLHRIIGYWPDGAYRVRGDNTMRDEHVADDQVIGVLQEFYRGKRHVVCAENRWYRRYWRCWLAIWPVRRLLKRLRWALGRVAHGILRPFGFRGLHPDGL